MEKIAKNLFVNQVITNGWTLERYMNIVCIYDKNHQFIGYISKSKYGKFDITFCLYVNDKTGNLWEKHCYLALIAKAFRRNIDYEVNVHLD